MNSEVIYHGRPFGGCSVLLTSALSYCIDFIDLNCKNLCCIKLRTPSYELDVSMYTYHVILIMRTTHMIIMRYCQLFLTSVVTITLHIAL